MLSSISGCLGSDFCIEEGMRKVVCFILLLTLSALGARAQQVQDALYRVVAHIKSDGTIQDDSYRVIGHVKGVPMEWAALYFFFR